VALMACDAIARASNCIARSALLLGAFWSLQSSQLLHQQAAGLQCSFSGTAMGGVCMHQLCKVQLEFVHCAL
jgi:hypothetical protein